jgi:hypothetical protein
MIYANIRADGHTANSLFANEDTVHRFNPTFTPRLLRQTFLERGIEINTPDLNAGGDIAFDLHLEGRPLGEPTRPRYLIALENPNINKLNASSDYCKQFDVVFAWDKRLFYLPHVVPILIPHPMVCEDFPGLEQRALFSCLINANKAFKEVLPTDLYLERLATIRWYEKHAPDQFALHGMGWEKSVPAFTAIGRLARLGSRLKTRMFGLPPFPSYRGAVSDKGTVLRNARFSYCYENSRDLSNYITEKIFDSLVHGCVPIYWGADNVLDYIPAGCFVDRRKFRDTAEVHRYLSSITDQEYAAFQANIVRFMRSDMAQRFSCNHFASQVVDHVCAHLKNRQGK